MTTANEPKRSHRIDGAIVALILTAIAYIAAFSYEATYLSYFGIPIEFVDVTLRELLPYGLLALIFMSFAILFSTFFWDVFLKSLPPAISKFVFILSLMSVANTAWILLTGKFQPLTIAGSIGPFLLICLLFVVPLFKFPHISRYRRRLIATYTESPLGDSFRPPSYLWFNIPDGVLPLVICTMVSIIFAFAFGEFRARTQIEFPVLNPVDPCIVLRVSTEGYLCVAFDPMKRAELGAFRIVELRGADIHMAKIGPLKPLTAQDRRLSDDKPKVASEKSSAADHAMPAVQQ